jgi:hypothetical protein
MRLQYLFFTVYCRLYWPYLASLQFALIYHSVHFPLSLILSNTNDHFNHVHIPLYSTYIMLSTISTNACEIDAFITLLHALNPFIDELLQQPEFHCFTSLPTELRCRVYSYYFQGDKKSIACENWIKDDNKPYIIVRRPTRRKSNPFLPNLCFISRTLRAEVTSVLLRALMFMVEDCSQAKFFVQKMDTCLTIPLKENVLDLILMEESAYTLRSLDHMQTCSLEPNHMNGMLMARCSNVRRLGLHFVEFDEADHTSELTTHRRLSLKVPFEKSHLSAVLDMVMLQRVVVYGEYFGTQDLNGAEVKLRGIFELAQNIKDGLEESERDTTVVVALDCQAWSGVAVL